MLLITVSTNLTSVMHTSIDVRRLKIVVSYIRSSHCDLYWFDYGSFNLMLFVPHTCRRTNTKYAVVYHQSEFIESIIRPMPSLFGIQLNLPEIFIP